MAKMRFLRGKIVFHDGTIQISVGGANVEVGGAIVEIGGQGIAWGNTCCCDCDQCPNLQVIGAEDAMG